MGRRRCIQDSPKELAQRIDAYFAQCDETRETLHLKSGDVRIRQVLPSMVGLAVYLGIGKASLYEYLDGKYDMPCGSTGNSDNTAGNGSEDIQRDTRTSSRGPETASS